jgi:hypothetical protein
MKKAKIVLWVIFLGLIAIIFFSNKDYFLAKQGIQINIPFSEPFQKTIKNLNAAATSQLEEISVLKKEIDSLKSSAFNSQTASEDQNMAGTT